MILVSFSSLEAAVADLNIATGNPTEQWDEPGVANIGNFHISQAYGSYALHQMTSTNGSVCSHIGYTTKTGLFVGIGHVLKGIDLGRATMAK